MNKFTRNDRALEFFVNVRCPLRSDSDGKRICFPFSILTLLRTEDSMA